MGCLKLLTEEVIMANSNEKSRLEFLKHWGGGLTNWTERYIPDALVIVWILSIITFIMALIWGDVGPAKAVQAWGKGFWILLKFGMQMCLIMMTGYILACSPPVRRLLNGISGWANKEKPWQAIMIMALFSMIIAWLNWGLSLIGSAMLALYMVKNNPKVDYRLLVASAYLGLGCTWHAGFSASAPLLVNTPDNFLIKGGYLTETISTTQTIFSPFNLILLIIIISLLINKKCGYKLPGIVPPPAPRPRGLTEGLMKRGGKMPPPYSDKPNIKPSPQYQNLTKGE